MLVYVNDITVRVRINGSHFAICKAASKMISKLQSFDSQNTQSYKVNLGT